MKVGLLILFLSICFQPRMGTRRRSAAANDRWDRRYLPEGVARRAPERPSLGGRRAAPGGRPFRSPSHRTTRTRTPARPTPAELVNATAARIRPYSDMDGRPNLAEKHRKHDQNQICDSISHVSVSKLNCLTKFLDYSAWFCVDKLKNTFSRPNNLKFNKKFKQNEYTHMCLYVCMHVCMYVNIYIYIYIYILIN